MAFYTSDFDDFGEYKYYSTPNYSPSYDDVPFQNSSLGSNDSTTYYDVVPIQDSISSIYESNNGYEIVPFQDSSFYSGYEYNEPSVFEYDPNAYRNAYRNAYDPSEFNYSTNNFIEPKLLEYNPVFNNTHYFSSDTRFVISYSNAPVFDDTEFDDYDPTPYDGGYDISLTYGKPLEPSDQLCYPRFVPGPDSISPINFSYGSMPSPYVTTENVMEKVPITKPIQKKEQPSDEGITVNEPEKPFESERYDGVNGEKSGNYSNNGYGSSGKSIIEYQGTYNGSGLEAMDLCEGLFGYWPCLDKKIRRECGNCEQVASEENQWRSMADYFFGSNVYYNYD